MEEEKVLQQNPLFKLKMFNLSKIIISLFGIGFSPWAPGTVASFFATLFFFLTFDYLSNEILFLSFIIIFLLSLKFIKIYSSEITHHDSKEIVIDEFLGIHLVVIFSNFFSFNNNTLMFILIFLIFRFFDIIKFYPINLIDREIRNSFGIIFDDIVAGLYTIISLFILDVYL